ncbi:hypothetical protein F4861DRAFT_529497 [Xylaria intraflava]|nr:hypothetical protein F4861DRAFT_529497 [Xylaria intraflava]
MTCNLTAALYPQYKTDTKIVAQWLDATSTALGFVSAGVRQRQAGVSKQYTIRIADFGLMADFLLLKGHVSIPSYIWSSLSRAIRYRSTYGDYLQQQRKSTTTSDRSHQFFIDVLRKVQRTLKSIAQPTAPVTPMTQPTTTATKFASLNSMQPATVEDDTEEDVSTPIQSKVSAEPSEDGVLFEPWEDDDEEALFLWRLFTVDVQCIREQIRQLWELYRVGHLSLASVATAHNMAIHMVRKLEQDINPILETFGGYVELSMTHFVQRYVGTAVDVEEMNVRLSRLRYKGDSTIPTPTVDAIIDGFDIAEEEMVFAWQVLLSEAVTWGQCGSFGSYNGKWGPFIPRDDRQNMTSVEKYNQDKAAACGVILDVQIMATFLNPDLGMKLDELSVAIEGLVPWKFEDLKKHYSKQFPTCDDKITFRAAFAIQLLLDSIHVLGTRVDHPGRELLDKTSRIFKSAKSLREFYKGPGALALGPLPGPSYVENIERAAAFWQGKDPINDFRQGQRTKSRATHIEKHSTLLRHNAPFCGWWLQTVQAVSYYRSITVANSISLPLACARLYFAFIQEGLVPKGSWPDMDAFTTLHRGDLWVGTAPRSGQYLPNLMLAGGNSAVSLASDARLISPAIRRDRAKFLQGSPTVSERIFEAFVDRGVEGLDEGDLERLIAHTKLRWYNGKAVMPCFHHGWDKAGNNKGDGNPTSSKVDNLFLRLAEAIDAEKLEQSFDYMSLNRVCWMVLRELMKKGRPILDAVGGPNSLKPDWEPAEGPNARLVIGCIFFVLFPPDGTVHREEASAIADILLNLTKALGRVVHTSTGIDWAQALKCSCAEIPS